MYIWYSQNDAHPLMLYAGYHSDESATPSPYPGHKHKRHKGESKQKHKKKKSKKKHKHKRKEQMIDVETLDSQWSTAKFTQILTKIDTVQHSTNHKSYIQNWWHNTIQ